ncbi:hypothetical protein LINPERHAP2_LOCUS14242 [Linum perenne]
MIMYW